MSNNRHLIFVLLSMIISLWAYGATPSESEATPDTTFISTKAISLDEVVVHKNRQRYSNRNNPAVEFVKRLRAMSDSIDPLRMPYFATDEYEKLILGMNIDAMPSDSVMCTFVDYSPVDGHPYITVSIKEQRSTMLHSHSPKSDKRIVEAYRSLGIDQSLDMENMRKVFQDVFRPLDLYTNDITLMQNRFVSPLSRIGPDFYKYYLTDTIMVGKEPCIELTFTPRNPESAGFTGCIYVPMADSTMFIRKVVMQTPRHINLNYVKSLHVVQEYEKDSLGNRIKTEDKLTVVLQLIAGTQEVYARRETRIDGWSYTPVEKYTHYYNMAGDEHFLKDALERPESYWLTNRPSPLSRPQNHMEGFMPHLRSKKLFFWGEKFLSLMEKGYLPTSTRSRFDIGPLNTLLSFNDVEGTRLRLGGITTGALSRRWFARAYGAYGFKDHKFKYGGELEYSFNDKKRHSREFPIHSLRLTINDDVDQIGQHYLFTNPDNIFLSLKRANDNLMTYRRLLRLDYTLEMRNGFSIQASLKTERQTPTQYVPFISSTGYIWHHYRQSAFQIQLRYSPSEDFYQSASQRLPINMDSPVILLTHEFGPQGLFGADFTINKTSISVQKRIWLSAFGYIDAMTEAVKLWSQAYYPALPWANANLSYTIQPESFSLLNPMELAADMSLSWHMTYWLNGLIFNRIPLIKRAKLREAVSFRGFWGHLSKKNNPDLHNNLPLFPTDSHTRPITSTPYMEISAGLDNIFTMLRVDYVWRLTYRDTPGIDKSGLRIALHFAF